MNNYHFVKNMYTATHPASISWDLTNRCNLFCKHCFNNSGDMKCHNFEEEFSKEKALDIARQIVKMKVPQCCLCGGEVTLCDYLFDVISVLVKGGVTTNMVSNGQLIDEEFARHLKQVGINHVQISLDGLGYQHDLFRNKKGAFDLAVRAIRALRKNKVTTMISFCPNKYNYRNFSVFLEYVRKLGCNYIRMMPLLPLGRGNKHFEELCLSEKEQFDFIHEINTLQQAYPRITLEWGDPLEHMALVMVNKRRNPAVMGICSNGNISVTPYINITVSNVYEKNLEEIWSEGYNKIWSNPQIREIVKDIQTIPDLCQMSAQEYVFKL